MTYLQKVGVCLIVWGAFWSAMNWLMLFLTYRTGRFHSKVPFVGGVPLAAGMLFFPSTRPFAWSGLILDPGTIVGLRQLPWLISQIWRTSRINLLEEYGGQNESKKVSLRLYRNQVLCMDLDLEKFGVREIGLWHWETDRLHCELSREHVTFEILLGGEPRTLKAVTNFGRFSISGVELKLKYPKADK